MLEVLLAAVGESDVALAPFAVGVALFTATAIVTWTPSFTNFHPVTMSAVPVADFVTLRLFDFVPGVDPIAALVAVPAMWLGFVLGRAGIAVAALSSVVVIVMPGFLFGVTHDPLIYEVSRIMFAVIASAGLALSTESWARQLARIEEKNSQLRQASRIKEDFIATVSHELRTPLTSIIGYLDLIKDDDSETPQHLAKFLDPVERNADRLLLLVTDLLSVVESQEGAMGLKRRATDMSSLVQVSVDEFSQRATNAQLRLTCKTDAGLVVSADPDRIAQVMDNLLSNAVKFTIGPGEVTVALRRVAGGVELTIQDTGMGVSPQEIAGLGTQFFRTRRATELAIPGIGVGLMLTKSIVQAHGGSLKFISHEDQGTIVHVFLPADDDSIEHRGQGPEPSGEPAQGSLLA